MNQDQPLIKYLDEPIRILKFSLHDIATLTVPIFIGLIFDSVVLIPGLGIGCVLMVKKLMRKFPKFYFTRWLYWVMPTKAFNKGRHVNLPNSSVRKWT